MKPPTDIEAYLDARARLIAFWRWSAPLALAVCLIASGLTGSLVFGVLLLALAIGVLAVISPRPGPSPLHVGREIKASAPVNTTARNLVAIGILGLFIGGLVVAFALIRDTTVEVSSGLRVHNIGLIASQEITLALGVAIGMGGLFTCLAGALKRRDS